MISLVKIVFIYFMAIVTDTTTPVNKGVCLLCIKCKCCKRIKSKCKRHIVCKHGIKKIDVAKGFFVVNNGAKKTVKKDWQYVNTNNKSKSVRNQKRVINRIKRYTNIREQLLNKNNFNNNFFGPFTIYTDEFVDKIKDSYLFKIEDYDLDINNVCRIKNIIDTLNKKTFLVIRDALTLLCFKIITYIIKKISRSGNKCLLICKPKYFTEMVFDNIFHTSVTVDYEKLKMPVEEKKRNNNLIPNYKTLKEIYFACAFILTIDRRTYENIDTVEKYQEFLDRNQSFENFFFLQTKCSTDTVDLISSILYRMLKFTMKLYSEGHTTAYDMCKKIDRIIIDRTDDCLPFLVTFRHCLEDMDNMCKFIKCIKRTHFNCCIHEVNHSLFYYMISPVTGDVLNYRSIRYEEKINFEELLKGMGPRAYNLFFVEFMYKIKLNNNTLQRRFLDMFDMKSD